MVFLYIALGLIILVCTWLFLIAPGDESGMEKYKNLKYEYRTVKYALNSGDSSKTMKFFHDLDAILQYEPATPLREEDANDMCLATLSPSAAPETTEGKKKKYHSFVFT